MENLRNRLFVALILLLTVGTAPPVLAADACPPLKGTWIDLTPVNGGYLVPVSIAGTPRMLALNLGLKFSEIDQTIINGMNLPTIPSKETFELGHGIPTAVVPAVSIGTFTKSNAPFLSRARQPYWSNKMTGVLGRDFLNGYDFELDFAHNKLGLFLPDHCPFVPYWKHDVVDSAPYRVGPSGQFSVPMILDGKYVYALVDTTSETSSIDLTSAHNMFKIDESNPSLTPAGRTSFGWVFYHYPFQELSIDNITIKPTPFLVTGTIPDYCRSGFGCRCWTKCEINLGLNILRRLRLYFDSKEENVYITRSDAAEPASAGPAQLLGEPGAQH